MFFSAARTAVWATKGQPFAACQIRFGAAIASAISAAAHGSQRASRRRSAVDKKPRGERDEVERDRVFGEKGDARDHARGQPPARLVVLLGLDDADCDREPGERLQQSVVSRTPKICSAPPPRTASPASQRA